MATPREPHDLLSEPEGVEDAIAGLESDRAHRLSIGQWIDYLLRAAETAFKEPPRPRHRTAAWPGSEEKLAVLEIRARTGRSLFHPGDLRVEGVGDRESLLPQHAGNFWTVGARQILTPGAAAPPRARA